MFPFTFTKTFKHELTSSQIDNLFKNKKIKNRNLRRIAKNKYEIIKTNSTFGLISTDNNTHIRIFKNEIKMTSYNVYGISFAILSDIIIFLTLGINLFNNGDISLLEILISILILSPLPWLFFSPLVTINWISLIHIRKAIKQKITKAQQGV